MSRSIRTLRSGISRWPSTTRSLAAWMNPIKALQQAARAQAGNSGASLIQRYGNAFLRGDKAGMEREVALSRRENPGEEDWLSDQEAPDARLLRPAARGAAEGAARDGTGAAGRPASRERPSSKPEPRSGKPSSGTRLRQGKGRQPHSNLSKGRDVQFGVALALALSGDSSESQTTRDRSGGALSGRFRSQSKEFHMIVILTFIVALFLGAPTATPGRPASGSTSSCAPISSRGSPAIRRGWTRA